MKTKEKNYVLTGKVNGREIQAESYKTRLKALNKIDKILIEKNLYVDYDISRDNGHDVEYVVSDSTRFRIVNTKYVGNN